MRKLTINMEIDLKKNSHATAHHVKSCLSWRNATIIGALLMICIIPIAYKEFIGGEKSIGRIMSSLLYAAPLCFLIGSVKKKWLFCLSSGILAVTAFIETMMVCLYDNFIIAGNIIAMFTTTADEGTGFIFATLHTVPYAIPVLLIYAAIIYMHNSHAPSRTNISFAAALLFLSALFLTYQLRVKWQGNITARFYIEQNILDRPPYNFFFQSYNALGQMKAKRLISEANKMSFGARRPNVEGKETYVLAVGESLRYDNLGIAGYKRNTTPLLATLNNLTLFSDYYSTANLTMYSVPQILTRATADDYSLSYKEKSIFLPFKECGFKIFVICSGNLLTYDTSNYLSNGCDSLFSLTEKDDNKIAHIVDSLSTIYKKTFFIVQFQGNHGPYRNFRKEQDVFHPNPVTDKVGWNDHTALVNAYDNTVRFTDYCVYSIIKAIDKPGSISAYMMVSDHGADYDTGVSDHGGNCNPRKPEYHVPFIFWYSEAWGKNYGMKAEFMKKNKDKPINADNVFYSACDMADITLAKKYAKPEWSVFSKALRPHTRKLLVPDGRNSIVVK